MPIETRRSFIKKSARIAVPVLTLATLNPVLTAFAESAPAAESPKSPSQLMESYMREILPEQLLPRPDAPFTPEPPKPVGKNDLLYRVFVYDAPGGERLSIALTATPSDEPKFLIVRLFEKGITGNVRSRFEEVNLNSATSKFNLTELLDQEPWNLTDNNEYAQVPTAEKTAITPEGYMDSLGARLDGRGPYDITYIAARSYPGSNQFNRRTLFAPSE